MASLPVGDWIYIPQFLSQQEADNLYAAMGEFPWLGNGKDESKFAVHYGKSYGAGEKLEVEHPINPILLPIAERVASVAHKQSNYIQCHRMDTSAFVRPHKDPRRNDCADADAGTGTDVPCRRNDAAGLLPYAPKPAESRSAHPRRRDRDEPWRSSYLHRGTGCALDVRRQG